MHYSHRKVTIDLLRHGEVAAPPAFFGSTNIGLSPLGMQQMKDAVQMNKLQTMKAPWERVISSPLLRCWDFAEHIAEQFDIPLEKENDLREIHFGQWDGLNAEEIEKRDPENFKRYISNPLEHTPPEGEKLSHFRSRISSSLKNIKQTHLDHRILLITHSGVIRSILCEVLNAPTSALFSIHCPYASFSQIEHYYHPEQQSDQLITHNSRLSLPKP